MEIEYKNVHKPVKRLTEFAGTASTEFNTLLKLFRINPFTLAKKYIKNIKRLTGNQGIQDQQRRSEVKRSQGKSLKSF